MFDKAQFEIPDAMRDMAERNVEQARSAYAQFMDMARKARDAVAKSQGAMAVGALDIQAKALQYAEQNINASFNFAADLARARDLKEYIDIQTRFAQRQMQDYARQAEDLGRMLTDAAQKVKP